MDVGFDTIGNATLICYDSAPVLVTDPWLVGTAYFGSWTFSHDIPEEQMLAIRQCQFVWLSHGHPDHLSLASLRLLKAQKILVPDHVGSRIATDLSTEGFSVQVLADRTWYQLSPRIRVFCIADYNQDGILLVDINGRLVVNINDASDRGWGGLVNRIIRRYTTSFLLRLSGFGDTDMINVFHETDGQLTARAVKKRPVGYEIAMMLRHFPARYFIPFSSMHRYQRTDSAWAEQYSTRLQDYAVGFRSHRSELLPAFLRWDCQRNTYEEISPSPRAVRFAAPEEYGDKWSDLLEKTEVIEIDRYFKAIEHLSDHFDFLNFRVGGRDNVVELSRQHFNRAISFEVPRNSLLSAVRHRIFDDLLIGNFMRTTLHGDFSKCGLYPDFTPYVAKYADNGGARSRDELHHYFEQYRRRAPIAFVKGLMEVHGRDVIRKAFGVDSTAYDLARRTYFALR